MENKDSSIEHPKDTLKIENGKENEQEEIQNSKYPEKLKKYQQKEVQIREDITIIVDKIAASVESLQEDNGNEDNNSNDYGLMDIKKKSMEAMLNDEISSESLTNIVSRIQVTDENEDDILNENYKYNSNEIVKDSDNSNENNEDKNSNESDENKNLNKDVQDNDNNNSNETDKNENNLKDNDDDENLNETIKDKDNLNENDEDIKGTIKDKDNSTENENDENLNDTIKDKEIFNGEDDKLNETVKNKDDLNETDENETRTTTFEMTEVINSVSIDFLKMISKETEADDQFASKHDSSIDNDDDLEVQYTDEQLERAYNEFKTRNILPSFLMRNQLLEYARRISLKFIVDEDYDKAKENDKDVDNLLRAYKNDGYNGFSDYNYSSTESWSSIKTNLEARLETAKKQQISNNIKFKDRISCLKNEEERKLEELEKIHEKERQYFIESCSNSSFLYRFSKPSSKLLQMRQLQKNLAIQHKFNEAKEIKIEADELQRKETKEARLRASECVKKLYKMLIQKQFNQNKCIIENYERKRNMIEENFQKEIEVNKNLTNLLEIRINEMNQKISSNTNPLLNSSVFFNSGKLSNSLNYSAKKKGKAASINQSFSSPSSTLPPLNSNYSSIYAKNIKRKREMIDQARKISSKLNVKLTNVQKIFVGVKNPMPVLKNTF